MTRLRLQAEPACENAHLLRLPWQETIPDRSRRKIERGTENPSLVTRRRNKDPRRL
jgi:hypothetical protein